MMSEHIKIIIRAAKETPRLYFAPLVAMFRAAGDVQRQMIEMQRKH